MRHEAPTYALTEVQALVASRQYRVTRRAREDAGALLLDESDICECIAALTLDDFYKTMPARAKPGLFQDVYKTRWIGRNIYLKVQVGPSGLVVVISFKRDGS